MPLFSTLNDLRKISNIFRDLNDYGYEQFFRVVWEGWSRDWEKNRHLAFLIEPRNICRYDNHLQGPLLFVYLLFSEDSCRACH